MGFKLKIKGVEVDDLIAALPHLFALLLEVKTAVNAASAGGKAITDEEKRAIGEKAISLAQALD